MVVANLLGALEGPELLIILALVVVLFGGKKLPQLARSLGQAKKEFQDGVATPAEPEKSSRLPEAADRSDETVVVSKAELERLQNAANEPTA
ncbi:MAG: Sec-independent protein translocase subunit TatA/TatB [Acidimicrobiales bacterium]